MSFTWLGCSGHTFSSTGPSVSPFRDFCVYVCVTYGHTCLPLCLIKLAATRSTQLHTAPQNSTRGKSAYQGSTSSTPSDVRSHRMHWLHHTHAECINDCIANKHNKHKNTYKKNFSLTQQTSTAHYQLNHTKTLCPFSKYHCMWSAPIQNYINSILG